MADWKRLADEELARRGRDLVRRGHYALGNEMLAEYCGRQIALERPIGASVMAVYGLSIGMTGDVHEGLETCQRALSMDRRNAETWAAIAKLSLQAGMKRKAVEAVTRGLALAPSSRELAELRESLGVRRRPPLPFLSRENALNVRLGRLLHRLLGASQRTKSA
jgi:tetratricopeptide (TPR) repeat protein